MPAITETAGTRRDYVIGQLRVAKVAYTSASNGDTWAPGIGTLDFAIDIISTSDAAVATTTVSGSTVTLVHTGTLSGTLVAFARG